MAYFVTSSDIGLGNRERTGLGALRRGGVLGGVTEYSFLKGLT